MRQKIRQLEICTFTFVLSLASLTRAHAGAPLDLVRTNVDRAIQILKDPELSSPDKKKERMDRSDWQEILTALTSESCEPNRTTSGKRPQPFRYRVIEDHEIPDR